MSNPMWKKPSRPSVILVGHALDAEGAAHDDHGVRILYNTVAGEGRARCECGALSQSLPSGAHRKVWHRDHKQEIREARA